MAGMHREAHQAADGDLEKVSGLPQVICGGSDSGGGHDRAGRHLLRAQAIEDGVPRVPSASSAPTSAQGFQGGGVLAQDGLVLIVLFG